MIIEGVGSELELDDIQANILSAYRADSVAYVAAQIDDPAGAKALLMRMSDPEQRPWGLTLSHAAQPELDYCLNIGITHAGLAALGVPHHVLERFPEAFREGPANRAYASASENGVGLGDIADSHPAGWELGGSETATSHLLFSLWTRNAGRGARSAAVTGDLRRVLGANGLSEVSYREGHALEGGRVHFGYRDGLSHVQIDGAPHSGRPNLQPPAPAGDFLLGGDHINSFGGNFQGNLPPSLTDNGTYGVLRIMRQDVRAFEAFLDETERCLGVEREAIAAQLMGRWRNGTPLAMAPVGEGRAIEVPDQDLDLFDYAANAEKSWAIDDAAGERCPVGSHIRRMNSRGGLAIGKPYSRRLVRRGMPYGPEFDPTEPDDGIERGMLGFFICGDIEFQFEFALRVWANQDLATTGIRGTRDPIIGVQPCGAGYVELRTSRGSVHVDTLPQLVRTRGSLYVLMPGLRGLRALAS